MQKERKSYQLQIDKSKSKYSKEIFFQYLTVKLIIQMAMLQSIYSLILEGIWVGKTKVIGWPGTEFQRQI